MIAGADIKFECTQCGQPLAADAAGAGLATNCPACSSIVVVPKTSTRPTGAGRVRGLEDVGSLVMKPSRPSLNDREVQALREELMQSSRLAGQLERSLVEAQAENARLRRQLDAAVAERETLTEAGITARSEADSLRAERGALAGALELNRQRLSATETHLAARERELAEIATAITRAQEEAEAARNSAHELRQELARAQSLLETTRQQLAEAKKAEADLVETQRRLTELSAQLDAAEQSRAELGAAGERLRTEIASLKRDAEESSDVQALAQLRARAETAEADHAATARALEAAKAEGEKLADLEQSLRREIAALLRRCEVAERHAEEFSDTKVQQDNQVLRGILARQKAELEQRYLEAIRYRRAHLGLRLVYAAVALGVVGLLALVVKVLPAAL